MPLVLPAVQSLLLANLAGNTIFGVSSPLLATAVATGFVTYAQTSLIATSVDVGTAGIGAGVAPVISLPSAQIIGPMIAALTAAGVNGPSKPQLANAISQTLSASLLTAQIVTVNTGVGVGTGKATLVPNSAVSVPLMIAAFTGSLLIGTASVRLATGIAQGIDAVLPSATAVLAIAGPPSPIPSSGVGVGKVL